MCSVCGKIFRAKSTLTQHMVIHSRPYACSLCSQTFMQPSTRDQHMKSAHTGERNHHCLLCEKSFRRRDVLTRHIRRVHKSLDLQTGCGMYLDPCQTLIVDAISDLVI